MIPTEKPPLAEVYLAHFGVKGMRWGFRKKDDLSGTSPSLKDYQKAKDRLSSQKSTPSENEKSIKKNEAVLRSKISPSDSETPSKKGLSPMQRNLLIAAGAAAVIGAGYMAYKYYNIRDPHVYQRPSRDDFANLTGKKISTKDYESLLKDSKDRAWVRDGTRYLKGNSLERPGKTIPAGNVFHRISTKDEIDYDHATYASSDLKDFSRYVATFRGEAGVGLGERSLKHVTFKTNRDLKIPSTKEALDVFKSFEEKRLGRSLAHEEVLSGYNGMMGGGWFKGRNEGFRAALQSKGFDGIIDEMDAGIHGEAPILVFNGRHLSKKASADLTKDLIKDSEAGLRDLIDRK